MRLHRLEVVGVGPFRDPQEIDFDELAASGLFLIEGATGSGKTTIIDAIVFALFGVMSGTESDPARIRSSYCDDDDPTGVACEFTVNERRHRITRVPARCRDPWEPSKPARSKPVRQTLTEYSPDGRVVRVLTVSREIDRHIVELLGMSAEQFRQLVVLPQGQFADLLRRTPVERLNALAPLLGDEFFRRIQEDLRARGDDALALRGAAREDLTSAAQQLAGRLRSHLDAADQPPRVDFTSADATDEERLAAVGAILAGLARRAREAADQRAAQEVIAAAVREEARIATATAEALKRAGAARQAVDTAESALDALDRGIPASDISGRIGELSRLEGALGDHAAWEADTAGRAAERAVVADRRQASEAEAHRLRGEQAAIPAGRETLEARRSAMQVLTGTLDACIREETRLGDLDAKARDIARLAPHVADLASALARAQAQGAEAVSAAAVAELAWTTLVERQRAERAADLAATLAEGQACPVCGSIEHPAPAHAAPGTVLVSELDVEAARRATTEARAFAAQASDRANAAHAALQQLRDQVVSLEGALDGHSEADMAARYAEARTATASARHAIADLPRIEGELDHLAQRGRSLDAEIAALDRQAAADAATLAALDESDRRRLARIRELTGVAGSATDVLASTQVRIGALTSLQTAQAALATARAAIPAERREIALDEAVDDATRATEALTAAVSSLAALADAATGLATAVDEATLLSTAFTSALTAYRDVEARTATAISLAALVTASNPKRLQLRSYALQRRFASVLTAASSHLERMSSGKFSFELSDDTARSGQSGLGIALHDAWTGHRQDPKSLSGGETFYASLSLALGLADVVRGEVGGSALETLFVDEGFGSLDQDILYKVLDQLDELRSGRRAVGVVSHVTEMKESIPDRVEVRRGADSTSTITRPATGSPT